MNFRTQQLLTSACVAMLTVLGLAQHATADDTEIFDTVPAAGVDSRPNILLIIDTSGSMVDNNVTQAMDYDPITRYEQKNNCNPDRIYWKTGSGAITCGNNYITNAAMVCKTAKNQIDTIGSVLIGSVAQWVGGSTKAWQGLSTSNNNGQVECYADAAAGHGLVDNDLKLPANGSNGPFTTNAAQAISLSGLGSYTFYKGNYINYVTNSGSDNLVTLTRLEVVKSVARKFLDSLTNVNVGLMRFQNKDSSLGTAQGGYVIHEFAPIETARQALKDQVTALNGNSYTPLSETLYEAYLYWTGGTPRYGNNTTSNQYSYSIDAARTSVGGNYRSPIQNSCATNFNVFLTDGDPTGDKDADTAIAGLPGFVGTTNVAGACSNNGGTGSATGQSAGDGRCLDDIAKYMYEKDLRDDPAVPAATDPKDYVRTYVIGFGTGITDASILGSTASAGGGRAYVATDTITLTEAFQDIARDVVDAKVSFTSPTVSVNAFNRTQNLNDLFITVFAPTEQYHWPGNLKKYRLKADGTIVDSSTPTAKSAVDPLTGFFANGTRSFWSDQDDGSDVVTGGAAHEIPTPASRKVYTDVAGGNLTIANNSVSDANTARITRALTGLPASATDAELTDHIKWIRGADIDDDNQNNDKTEGRFVMGDPLHAKPVSVIYRGTATSPTAVIYASTNDGYLHAINPSDGSELWSYIPSELLPRMYNLRTNDSSPVKRYGLDGNIRAHKIDRNNNGIVETGDRVLLFFGMGRGGTNYYALDVTNENSPQLLWKHGRDDTFIGLGQTWSTPVVTRVNVSGATQNPDKLVVIFGGGYDVTQDNVAYNTDDRGNRLFIVDAISGNVLWHAGPTNVVGLGYDSTANFTHPKLKNSIPADIRVVDMSGDGFADRMYASDTGGRIWRFDIHNGNPAGTASSQGSTADSLVTGGVFASLGVGDGTGTSPTDARRFYNAPDVSLVKGSNGATFVNIAVGSGHRGTPKNDQIADRFYSLRDFSPFTMLTQDAYNNFTTITDTDSNLIDVTSTVNPTISPTDVGWKIRLVTGEKSLAEARTFQGSILFTTFNPGTGTVVNGCRSIAGINSLYAVRVSDGAPPRDRDGDATLETEDRRTELRQQGLAPEAVILFPSPDDPANCVGQACSPPPVCLVGVEACGVSFGNGPVKTFWMQEKVD